MRKTTPHGAVISGRLADSILVRLPVLSQNLGPVASSSKRLASRYANTLRAGWAAGDWAELSQTRLIYLQVPRPQLNSTLAKLIQAIGRWDRRLLVLLDDDLDCGVLDAAACAGAVVASLAHIQIGQSDVAVVEGSGSAVPILRRTLARGGVKVLQLSKGDKAVYSAALNLGRLISCALTDTVVRSLRKAGIDPALSRRITGWIADRAVAEVLTKGHTAPRIRSLPAPLLDAWQIAALSVRDARIGRFSRSLAAAVAEFRGEEPGKASNANVPDGHRPVGLGKAAGT